MQHGWQAFLVLSAVLMAATSAGMLIFTSLSLAGFKRLGLQWVERYEETILGVALIAMVGLAVAFFKTVTGFKTCGSPAGRRRAPK
jgi:nickel/cobalt exporter